MDENKIVLCGANAYEKKYYFNEFMHYTEKQNTEPKKEKFLLDNRPQRC